MDVKINCGSGQRRFDVSLGWVNVDLVSREGQVPDIIADGAVLPFDSASSSLVVLHHVLEHFGCGEADGLIRECHRVLQPGGSLLVFVPDLWKLAQRWMIGEIDDYIYCVNLYGAYQGDPGSRHYWGVRRQSLVRALSGNDFARWSQIKPFDWRLIPGADLAKDWWICAMEAVK